MTRPEDLPEAARARLRGLRTGVERASISATLDLPAARALAYVNGCPGITASGGIGDEAATVQLRVTSFEALSRLAQSEVVESISVEPEVHVVVN